ncbi:MAG: sugar phosphate isomerase/epimerase [Chloroflexia bacterium]|nr:sugar phosphate isomerase/epimerase [Chloroflexia bacterium]
MSMHIGQNPIGLAAYSFPWRCGFAGAGTPRACPRPYDAHALLELAAYHNLATVEIPLDIIKDRTPHGLKEFRKRADSLGIAIVLDGAVIDEAMLAALIPAAAALRAPVARVMLSGMLEGARATFPGGWEAHLAKQIAVLQKMRPLAEQYNVIIAPENHQDLNSADLIRICDEVGGAHIGVTLDAVNPLAVAEDPITFAQALGHRIVNVHLKDYFFYLTNHGYLLVRSALGQGVLDLPSLFDVLATHAPTATCNIELAAINARHIRVFEPEWWQGYPTAYGLDALRPLLAFAAQHVSNARDDWRTPWERDADELALGIYEETQFTQSVAHLRTLIATTKGNMR